MISELSKHYLHILKLGFIILEEAIHDGDTEWISAEIEYLHNIPSLVNETKPGRHIYFWDKERTAYLNKIRALNKIKAESRCATYYEPIWRGMEAIILSLKDSEQ